MDYKTITIERVINAPMTRVFDAFITPADLVHWYYAGEDGWTTPYAEVDAVEGGRFIIGFKDPTGKNTFDFTGTYTEVNRPHKIAYNIDDGRPVTVDFEELGDKTKITMIFAIESQNSEDLQRSGWSSQIDHLQMYLAKEA